MPFNGKSVFVFQLLEGTCTVFVLDPMQVDAFIDEIVGGIEWQSCFSQQING